MAGVCSLIRWEQEIAQPAWSQHVMPKPYAPKTIPFSRSQSFPVPSWLLEHNHGKAIVGGN